MKKKFYLIVAALLVTTLVGCGKTQKDEDIAFLQEEFGLSKEDAKEVVDAYYEVMEENIETATTEENEEADFKIFDILPEVKNSTISDSCFQINDVVLHYDGSMTLSDTIDILANSELGEHFFFTNENKVDVNVEGLTSVKSWTTTYVYYDDLDTHVLTLQSYNPYDELTKLGDTIVGNVQSSPYNIHALNMYDAGGINACINENRDWNTGKMYSEKYSGKVYEVNMDYSSIDSFLADAYAYEALASGEGYQIFCKPVETKKQDLYFGTGKWFFLDLDSAQWKMTQKNTNVGNAEKTLSRISRVSQIPEELIEEINSVIDQQIKDAMYIQGSKDNSLYAIEVASDGVYFIYILGDGKYTATFDVGVLVNMDESIDCNAERVSLCYSTYDTWDDVNDALFYGLQKPIILDTKYFEE